ncbi:SAV_6107 family HEPN domain-containing protein [Candidatus Blastococcus massiliensis]|uniref:SAV_6107 family HEPN domain-containing protein n=1 Tax=Candidatus Blastococcus massiliensis TaxID=1470358 RepID=UPI0006877568|nr:SAV_6107 family HEPN domain-containing protein [Candidatus Blastococcus massiliensis]
MGARPLMADQLPLPPALPAAAATLLDQARRGLAEAAGCADARQRYATAHLGALRAAAAVLAARTRPEVARRRPRSAWVLLGQVAPELGEWATFFAAGAAKRAAAEAGLSHAVTEREADDLVRDVGGFLAVVESCLGVDTERVHPRPRVVGGTATEYPR